MILGSVCPRKSAAIIGAVPAVTITVAAPDRQLLDAMFGRNEWRQGPDVPGPGLDLELFTPVRRV